MMRAARLRANLRAAAHRDKEKTGMPWKSDPVAVDPRAGPSQAEVMGMAPVADSAVAEAAQTSEPPYIPPGMQPGDVQIPEGPDTLGEQDGGWTVVSNEPIGETGQGRTPVGAGRGETIGAAPVGSKPPAETKRPVFEPEVANPETAAGIRKVIAAAADPGNELVRTEIAPVSD